MADKARDNHTDCTSISEDVIFWMEKMAEQGERKSNVDCRPLTKIDKIRIKHSSGKFGFVTGSVFFLATNWAHSCNDRNENEEKTKLKQ